MSKRKVKTFSKNFSSGDIHSVEVGTNTPMGGDAGHGGKTIFELKGLGCGGWYITVNGEKHNFPKTVKLEFFGDFEALAFIEALEFAADKLRTQISENKSKSM